MSSATNKLQFPLALLLASLTICSCAPFAARSETLTSQSPNQPNEHRANDNNNIFHGIIDAPKLYHLNELLYKTTNGAESPQSAALPSFGHGSDAPTAGHLKPRGMSAAAPENDDTDDHELSIEGLVRRMRGRRPQEAAGIPTSAIDDEPVRANGVGPRGLAPGVEPSRRRIAPEDEASIQRKSTNLDDDSTGASEADYGSASRIQARDKTVRRRRRASARQAPPKLKSRRVSRNSRRRKLRHGIKPRRRA